MHWVAKVIFYASFHLGNGIDIDSENSLVVFFFSFAFFSFITDTGFKWIFVLQLRYRPSIWVMEIFTKWSNIIRVHSVSQLLWKLKWNLWVFLRKLFQSSEILLFELTKLHFKRKLLAIFFSFMNFNISSRWFLHFHYEIVEPPWTEFQFFDNFDLSYIKHLGLLGDFLEKSRNFIIFSTRTENWVFIFTSCFFPNRSNGMEKHICAQVSSVVL